MTVVNEYIEANISRLQNYFKDVISVPLCYKNVIIGMVLQHYTN